jgi:hypothetical protein
MNDNEGLTDRVGKQGVTEDSLAAHQARRHPNWVEALKHRWPTALGIAVAALTAFDEQVDVEFVSFLSAIVVLSLTCSRPEDTTSSRCRVPAAWTWSPGSVWPMLCPVDSTDFS